MATLFNAETVIKYIDPTATSNGTGNTVNDPLNAIPVMASLASNTAYVIRRTDTPLLLQYGTINASAVNFYLIGFPKKEDWLWPLMEEDAQDAWGSDTADYVTFQSNATANSHVYVFANTQSGDQGFHRLSIQVPEFSTAQAVTPWWFIGTSTANSLLPKGVFVTNCEFRPPTPSIEDDQVVSANNSSYACWFKVTGCTRVRFENVNIIYPGRNSNSTTGLIPPPFFFGFNRKVYISNINVIYGTEYYFSQDSSANCINYNVITTINCSEVKVEDADFQFVVQQTSGTSYLRGAVAILGANYHRTLSRINVKCKKFINETSKPTSLSLMKPMIDAWTSGGYIVESQTDERPYIKDEDINIDMYPCWNTFPTSYSTVYNPATVPVFTWLQTQAYPVVRLVGPFSNAANSVTGLPAGVTTSLAPVAAAIVDYPEGYTKNITVKVPPYNSDGQQTDGIGVFHTPWALQIISPNSPTQGESIKGLNLFNPWGGSLALSNKSVYTSNQNATLPPVDMDEVHGGLFLTNAGFVTINKLVCNRAADVFNIQGSNLYINDVVLNATEWVYEIKTFTNLTGSRVVFNKTNTPFIFSNVFSTISSYGRTGLIINSEDNVNGKWKSTNNFYIGETTNIYRTGGAPSSIKLYAKSNTRVPLNIGYPGFENIELTAPKAGRYNILTRFMHSNFATTAITSYTKYLVIYVTALQRINGRFVLKEFTSELNGHWDTDNSIWNNEEYMKPVLNRIPILLEDSGNPSSLTVSVRIEYDLYDANGRFYFDPAIELEPIVDYGFAWTDPYALISTALTAVVDAENPNSSLITTNILNVDGYNPNKIIAYLTYAPSIQNGRQYTFSINNILKVLKNSIATADPEGIIPSLNIAILDTDTYFTTDSVTLIIPKMTADTVPTPPIHPGTSSVTYDYDLVDTAAAVSLITNHAGVSDATPLAAFTETNNTDTIDMVLFKAALNTKTPVSIIDNVGTYAVVDVLGAFKSSTSLSSFISTIDNIITNVDSIFGNNATIIVNVSVI